MSERIEFVANLSLEECRERLETLHEKAAFLAARGQTRISVNITSLDPNAYQFSLKRVGKSSFKDNIGMHGFSGELRILTTDTTSVVGQPQINWYFLSIAQIFIAFLTVSSMLNVLIFQAPTGLEKFLYLFLAFIFNIATFLVMYLWAMWRGREMQNLALKVLGYNEGLHAPIKSILK